MSIFIDLFELSCFHAWSVSLLMWLYVTSLSIVIFFMYPQITHWLFVLQHYGKILNQIHVFSSWRQPLSPLFKKKKKQPTSYNYRLILCSDWPTNNTMCILTNEWNLHFLFTFLILQFTPFLFRCFIKVNCKNELADLQLHKANLCCLSVNLRSHETA